MRPLSRRDHDVYIRHAALKGLRKKRVKKKYRRNRQKNMFEDDKQKLTKYKKIILYLLFNIFHIIFCNIQHKR